MISYKKDGTTLARWSGSREELERIAEKEKKKAACARIVINTEQIYP